MIRRTPRFLIIGICLLPIVACCGPLTYWRILPTDISRAQYDQALAKWQAQQVLEYTIAGTRVCMCPYQDFQLRVVDGKIDPAHSTVSGQQLTTNDHDVDKQYGFLTVASRFAALEQVTRPQIDFFNNEVFMRVTFDERLGYPNHVKTSAQPGVTTTDLGSSYDVTDLTVLKTKNEP